MQQGDIIRITDVQAITGFSGQIRNVYFYRVFTMTGVAPLQIYAEDIAQAFGAQIITPMAEIQSTALTHIELEFFNMSDQLEEATQTWDVAIPGVNGGDWLPANVAYSFKLQRYDRVVRNGAKRISGIPEGATVNGKQINGAFVPSVTSVANAFAAPLLVEGDSVDATLTPVIVRVPTNPGVTPQVYTVITEGSFRGIGTQNTRKQF